MKFIYIIILSIPFLIFLAILAAFIGAIKSVATAVDKLNAETKEHADLLATQLNQEAERRHQETVAALQDIAKAIRECNEE